MLVKEEAVSTNSWSSTATVPPPSQMGLLGTISIHRKSNKKVPREHEDEVQRTAAQSSQPSAGDSSPSVSGVSVTTPVSLSKPFPKVLLAGTQHVMDSLAIDSQNRRRMRQQSSSRSSCTLKASVWTITATHTFVIFMALFCPPVAVAQSCSVSSNTADPCTGLFQIQTSPFPMLDMTEGCCACVVGKCFTLASLQAPQPSANNPLHQDSVYGAMLWRNYCKR